MTGRVSAGVPVLNQPAIHDQDRRIWDQRLIGGLAIVAVIAALALLAPALAPAGPHAYVAAPLAAPSLRHPLGADDTGRDILSQLLYGARVSLLVGLTVGIISTAIAWIVGLLSGLSRAADATVRGIVDLTLMLPPLLLIMLIAAYLGAGLPVVIITLSLMSWGPFARIIRAQVQSEVRKPYVEAARALGASPLRIVLRHVAPSTISIAMAKFVLTVQYAIVVQASLTFLGLGNPSTISWGGMVHRAALSPLIFLSNAWLWWLLPPSLAIALMVVGFALAGWSIEERGLPGLTRRTDS